MTLQTILHAVAASGMAHNGGAGGEFILMGTQQQLEAFATRLRNANAAQLVTGVPADDGCTDPACTACRPTLKRG